MPALQKTGTVTILLLLIAAFVGFLYGSTGVGGIILIPAITLLAGIDTHTAMATALASFMITSPQVTWLFYRRGALELPVLWPMVAGGLPMGYVGALTKSLLHAPVLNAILATLVMLAAVNIFRPAKAGGFSIATGSAGVRTVFLVVLGGVVAFVAGLTGVGGPIISIPVMIFFGFMPLCAIAAGQAFVIAAALTGTIGNLLYGHIDWFWLVVITVGQLAGTTMGVRLACSLPTDLLRKVVAVTCIAMSVLLFMQSFGWMG